MGLRRRSRRTNIMLSVAAIGGGASLSGLTTYASFTSSTSATHTVSTGTVGIALGSTGAATNRLTVNASGVGPGDVIQRSFDLSNTGDMTMSAIALTSSASPSSLLDTDTTNGLQMVVDRCSAAWTESGSSPNFSYSCSGSTTTIIASRAVLGTNIGLPGLSALAVGGLDHLRLTLTLPSGAPNTLQGQTSTITYSFVGTH